MTEVIPFILFGIGLLMMFATGYFIYRIVKAEKESKKL